MASPQAQDIVRCRYCEEEPAVLHCAPCGDDLCTGCKVLHLKSKVPSGHKIFRLSKKFQAKSRVKMCDVHSSKSYEACKDCQVPVCIVCIQEIHGEHAIGKIQDLYEKQKAEIAEELSKIKTQLKSEIIQRVKDLDEGEKEVKTCQESIREKMRKQGQDFINHIISILKEALHDRKKTRKGNLRKYFSIKKKTRDLIKAWIN
ncbi:tripartite motif-containing protein 29-like [Saccostrea cucullata]|uniref:tripartite motif-containing protein 29-like n=1 Tax=Saccostrea cuccullata TaxID=36930 RepID=UPI002ECFB3F4